MELEQTLLATADLFGIGVSTLEFILSISVICMLSLSAFTLTGSILIAQILACAGGWVLSSLGLLPLWIAVSFTMMSILYFLSGWGLQGSYIGGFQGREVGVDVDLERRIRTSSERFSEYTNNLDTLLGVKTIEGTAIEGLLLTQDKRLLIGSEFNWFVYDKHPKLDVFKVVGLHSQDPNRNYAYLLGRTSSGAFSVKIPKEELEESCSKSLKSLEF